MGVDDIRPDTAIKRGKAEKRPEVVERRDVADQCSELDRLHARIEHACHPRRPLPAMHKPYLVPRLGLMIAGEQGILIRPAINETGNDMNDTKF
jgi:hypothetical protein